MLRLRSPRSTRHTDLIYRNRELSLLSRKERLQLMAPQPQPMEPKPQPMALHQHTVLHQPTDSNHTDTDQESTKLQDGELPLLQLMVNHNTLLQVMQLHHNTDISQLTVAQLLRLHTQPLTYMPDLPQAHTQLQHTDISQLTDTHNHMVPQPQHMAPHSTMQLRPLKEHTE
jgi:hypothetical protein